MKNWIIIFILSPVLMICLTLSCKKDKCADQYCLNGGDCIDGRCQCPTGYTGEHCEDRIPTPGYNCVNGNCTFVSDNADHATLAECQNVCSGGATPGYSCVSGNCQYVTDNAGYTTLAQCESVCGGSGGTCSGNTTITACSGSISDGSGNFSNYDNFMDCSWTISPPGAGSVSLTFTAFATEAGYDFVRIYNGNSAGAPLIGIFDGTTLPGTLTATSGKMFIQFTTDVSGVASGWSATYSCNTGNPTPGYNCVSGNCQYVSDNATYGSLNACENACGGGNAGITFRNNAFTPMTITFNGSTQTAPAGGTATFNGAPGATGSGTGHTSGMTTQGSPVGLSLQWNLYEQFPFSGTKLVNLNVSSEYFFLRMINNGAGELTDLYVNYGLTSQTFDNISIPNSGQTINIGYYKAWSNTNVRAYATGIQNNVVWPTVTLPFTENQSATLSNQYSLQTQEQ